MTIPNQADKPARPTWREIHPFVEAFETALIDDPQVDLADFLPQTDHPLFATLLRELVRVDLDHAWQRGQPQPLERYKERFPVLREDLEGFTEVAFEEFRLRRRSGETPSPKEYQERFGVNTAGWPEAQPLTLVMPRIDGQVPVPGPGQQDWWQRFIDSSGTPSADRDMLLASRGYQEFMAQNDADVPGALDSWCASFAGSANHAQLFRDLHRSDPDAARRLAEAMVNLPEVGTDFLGFHLVEELGQGAFAKVFLAHQGDLANRLVAVKIAGDLLGESQTLAQLQHTHIMPIYSVHRAGPLQAVCMPYLGSTTLGDVLRDVTNHPSLPDSGKSLVSTVNVRKKKTLLPMDARSSRAQEESQLEAGPTSEGPASQTNGSKQVASGTRDIPSRALPGQTLPLQAAVEARNRIAEEQDILEKMSYVDTILWMAVRVADGLGHAHEHGILHLDLKPANILLTDDFQPMLLDFNLSQDTKQHSPSAACVGGTLPYMAPEQIEAFSGGPQALDARSDLYALGLILYELLTGQLPGRVSGGRVSAVLTHLQAQRREPPRKLRCWNGTITPAVEAIVQKCLQPNPEQRYQSARQLQEDLQRQLNHQPLKYARDPSWRERLRKFRHRHPRLTSAASVALVAMVLLIGLGGMFVVRSQNLARREAQESLAKFRAGVQTAMFDLTSHTAFEYPDGQKASAGLSQAQELLDDYQVRANPNWRTLPAVRNLPGTEQERLSEEMGQLLLIQARTLSRRAEKKPVAAQRQEPLQEALNVCELAETCFPGNRFPRALWYEKAEVMRLLGRQEEEILYRTRAAQIDQRTAQDFYLAAFWQADKGHFREALPLAQEATRLDPQDFNASFLEGLCHDHLSHNNEAVVCYRSCIALKPKFFGSYFNRGLAYFRQGVIPLALRDFEKSISLNPDFSEAYIQRALANQQLGQLGGRLASSKYQETLADLNEALQRGAAPGRILLMRGHLKKLLGDTEGAKQDLAEGLKEVPANEEEWVARGIVLLEQAPEQALADFNKALELNPRSLPALQDKAHVLAKYLKRTEEAISVLDRTVELYPDDVRPLAGRGVLLARLGKRQEALRDAETARVLDHSPPNLYQIAGIYALTSRQNPGDRLEAFRLLAFALRKGFGFSLLEKDRDLDPIRQLPEFGQLVKEAKPAK